MDFPIRVLEEGGPWWGPWREPGPSVGIAHLAAPPLCMTGSSLLLPELQQLLLQPSPLLFPSPSFTLSPSVFFPWILHVLNS